MKIITGILFAALLAVPVFAVESGSTHENLISTNGIGEEVGNKDQAEEVINTVEQSEVFQDKENYLLMKANDFLDEGKFEEAKVIAEYVLSKMNTESEAAKDLLALASENIDYDNNIILSTTGE